MDEELESGTDTQEDAAADEIAAANDQTEAGSGVAAADFDELAEPNGGAAAFDMDAIGNIPVTLAMELGRTSIAIGDLLKLNQGSVIGLDRLAGDPLDVLVNGCLIAHGEVVVVNEKFGIRVTDVLSPDERLKQIA